MDQNTLKHNRLTDYQVAEAFGPALSLIYKDKIAELDAELQEVTDHLETLNIPRYSDFDRWFARSTLPGWAKQNIKAIEDMTKIRALHLKMNREPNEERLNIEKARSVPITQIYDFKRRGTNVSCPIHGDDKHPSASIKYNHLVCFTCGIKLDGIGLFMRLNHVNFTDAVKALSA